MSDTFELFIFSEAGKPVYSFTKRDDTVTLMPLCSALINYAKTTQKEALKSIRTSENLIINFSTRSPLVYIVIEKADSCLNPQTLVEQLEAQVISILTAKTLKSVFEDRPTFDLKRLLYGSEKLIDATTNSSAFITQMKWLQAQAFLTVTNSSKHPHHILVPTVIMPPSARDSLNSAINNVITTNSNSIVFSLLFKINEENFELVTVCNHHDRHKLKPADIHIIQALLVGSRTQLESVESLWMPVCLPKFNQDAFLHSYISYVNGSEHCLVMMSIDREEFSSCQKSKDMIEKKLANLKSKTEHRLSPNVHPDQLQFLWYQTSKLVLWWRSPALKPIDPMLYYIMKKMPQSNLKHLWLKQTNNNTFLGWHMPTFQLYAKFDSELTTIEATEAIQKMTNWMKKEEDNFVVKL